MNEEIEADFQFLVALLGDSDRLRRIAKQFTSLVDQLVYQNNGLFKELHEAEQILGVALGYSYYVDDPKNFPDATVKDGVNTGPHTVVTLAMEAAGRIARLSSGEREQ